MPIATPPVWTDPASGIIDVANGSLWAAATVDAMASNFKVLGGADGASGSAGRPAQLLVNGGFERWQRGGGGFSANGAYTADRWDIGLATSTMIVTQETTTVDAASASALKLVYTFAAGGLGFIEQKIEDVTQLRGRLVTFSCRINSTVTGVVAFAADSGGSTGGAANATIGAWETINVTRLVSANATSLAVNITLPAASCTVFVDNAMLVIAGVAVPYQPLHPADELARCQRYYEILGGSGDQSIVVGGYNAAGLVVYTTIPFKVAKPVVPTVTIAGTWNTNNCGQPSVFAVGTTAVTLRTTITALGYGDTYNGTAGNLISLESNP